MSIRPKAWLLALAAWIPAEDFVLKWLPVPDIVFIGLRLLPELVLFALLGGLMLSHAARRIPWAWSGIGWVIIAFTTLSLASFLWNGGSLFNALINLRTMLRYVAVYLIVINLDWHEREIRRLLQIMLVAATVQCLIGWAQYFGPPGVLEFFQPRETATAAASLGVNLFDNELKLGAVFGTFGKPGQFALFLLFAAVILMTRGIARLRLGLPIREAAWTLFLAAGVFMSYKRGPLLLLVLMVPVMFWLAGKRMVAYAIGATAALAVVALLSLALIGPRAGPIASEKSEAISPMQSLLQLTTETYWRKTATSSRGWFILDVGGRAIQDMGPLGYGPDDLVARRSLARNGGAFSRLIEFAAFEDVYWVAMFLLYGPIGLACFWLALWLAFRRSLALVPRGGLEGEVGVIAAGLICIAVPINLLERALEMRSFSFYLWFLIGLAVVASASGFRSLPMPAARTATA